MKDERALQYYERLLSLGSEREHYLPLNEVADILCTTTRHARTVIQSLHKRGWLAWNPKVGRNQRSSLTLHFDSKTLRQKMGRELIEQGQYESAFSLLHGDQEQFSQLLQQTSGTMVREGQLHIQLTYQRVFQPILPHTPLRNSERFLVRQVYSCLTGCDHEGKVSPQLAHHWRVNDAHTEWCFYLRPRLEFHSGTPLTPEIVANLFNKLRLLPEYQQELAHLEAVHFGHQTVTFILSQPDVSFDALLSDIRYSIQPPKQVNSLVSKVVDGSGVFRVIEHSSDRLRLEANDRYFGLAALTDTVTIWQLDETATERIELDYSQVTGSDSVIKARNPSIESHTQTRIENGCIYALLNASASSDAMNAAQRAYLFSILSPNLILDDPELNPLSRASIPAHNVLPSWTKIRRRVAQKVALPNKLSIAVYDHLVILDCARAIKAQLESLGVTCEIHTYSLEVLHQMASQGRLKEEMIIASFIVDDNLPVSVFRWLCSDALLRHGLEPSSQEWLDAQLLNVRQQHDARHYMPELESIATTLLMENQLLPLFHHRQTLRWGRVLQGVSITDWSWPDFSSVWMDEEPRQQ